MKQKIYQRTLDFQFKSLFTLLAVAHHRQQHISLTFAVYWTFDTPLRGLSIIPIIKTRQDHFQNPRLSMFFMLVATLKSKITASS